MFRIIDVLFLVFWSVFAVISCANGQAVDCGQLPVASSRRDCYPWSDGVSEEKCRARGCLWCPSEEEDSTIPCFYDDDVCPSLIDDDVRVGCPAGGSLDRNECLQNGCIFCASGNQDALSCFVDESVSLGGDFCPGDIPAAERIDCYPEARLLAPVNKTTCLARGCFWCDDDDDDGAPPCFAPRQQGYRISGAPEETPTGFRILLQRIKTPSWYGADVENVLFEVEYQTNDRLHITLIDTDNPRFTLPLDTIVNSEVTDPKYEVTFEEGPAFGFKVLRKQTGDVIFDTTVGGLQFADQFLQIATRLDSDMLYGFGEHHHHSIQREMNWNKLAMWTRDHLVQRDVNLYGHHPFYLNLELSSSAHGVLFHNANAQDVTLMPGPGLTYRTIGGILDIYFFLGPTPENVVQQYHQAIGPPVMVPYWRLGFHLSRWGYDDLDHMKAAVGRMRQYDIPHDVQFADIDYMDGHLDFTLDPINFAELPQFIEQLHDEGTRTIIILDPGISNQFPGNYTPFDEGQRLDIWIKNSDGITPAEAVVWPGRLFFPDFSNPVAGEWWINQTIAFKDVLNFDGLWIDMNEPSNFIDGTEGGCNDTQWNNPPFTPSVNRGISTRTLCPDTKQKRDDHYNVHSLYAYDQSKPSLDAARLATGSRSIVISRSSFPGSGRYAQHWLGDNYSLWRYMRSSIIGSLEFNMFGYPFVGADICGFTGRPTEEMCQRWQQLGSFYTFSRNHNADRFADQDPGIWPEVARVTRETLLIRYTLLPYLYTLFYSSHTVGGTVMRPLFFEFPQDVNTYNISDQFLWGSAFMISPVLEQGVESLDVYFPDAVWYSYYDGGKVGVSESFLTIDAPLDFIPLHIRGGSILPIQQPANCTDKSRQNSLGLIVALDDIGTAAGSLFWDDGESIDSIEVGDCFIMQYSVTNQLLRGLVAQNTGWWGLYTNDVIIMGIGGDVASISVNGQQHDSWSQDPNTLQVVIADAGVLVPTDFTISWTL